jgi:hypothetical protein
MLICFGAVFVWKWKRLPPELPLFYSLPRGEDQLGSPSLLFIFPGISLVMYLVNLLFASVLYTTNKTAAKLLVAFSVVAAILLFITFCKIVLTVT